jgi:hypothetical protein
MRWPMTLPRYYSKKHLEGIREKYLGIQKKTDNLLVKFVAYPFLDEKAGEYARHGFARRIQTLERCIHNLFRIIPPGVVKVPRREKLHDAQIQLQAFLANAYGCVDNLAWVWVHECGLRKKLKPNQVGLRKHNIKVRKSLSAEFQNHLSKVDDWFDYLADYRHALAHRIPPYIPPGSVRSEDTDTYNELQRAMNKAIWRSDGDEYDKLLDQQRRLYVFQPLMGHSLNESKGIVRFHMQILADFLTVEELALKMLDEVRALLNP